MLYRSVSLFVWIFSSIRECVSSKSLNAQKKWEKEWSSDGVGLRREARLESVLKLSGCKRAVVDAGFPHYTRETLDIYIFHLIVCMWYAIRTPRELTCVCVWRSFASKLFFTRAKLRERDSESFLCVRGKIKVAAITIGKLSCLSLLIMYMWVLIALGAKIKRLGEVFGGINEECLKEYIYLRFNNEWRRSLIGRVTNIFFLET